MDTQQKSIYKVFTVDQWKDFQRDGNFAGAPIDLSDGFIHFSAYDQVKETVAKHFAGQGDLILAEVASAPLGDALRWEVSRGGQKFPHLYAELPLAAVISDCLLRQLDSEGHQFPQRW